MDFPTSKAAELRLDAGRYKDRVGGTPGSIITGQDFLNPVLDELIALQTAAGLTADEATLTQVRDAALILSRGGALGFRVKPQDPVSLSVDIEAGAFFSRTTGLMVSVGAATAGPIVAPGANPRNDIVYIDAITGAVGIAAGAEDAAPVDPALPADKLPVQRIKAYVGMTVIAAADLEELRYLDSVGVQAPKVLQTVTFETGAVATGTNTMPLDDTIPQNTEGDEYMTLAITPKSADSRLKIDIVISITSSTANTFMTAALFRDAITGALAASIAGRASSGLCTVVFSHDMPSPGLAATTFKVRGGNSSAGTTTFNGLSGGRFFGGTFASSIIITEYLP